MLKILGCFKYLLGKTKSPELHADAPVLMYFKTMVIWVHENGETFYLPFLDIPSSMHFLSRHAEQFALLWFMILQSPSRGQTYLLFSTKDLRKNACK